MLAYMLSFWFDATADARGSMLVSRPWLPVSAASRHPVIPRPISPYSRVGLVMGYAVCQPANGNGIEALGRVL